MRSSYLLALLVALSGSVDQAIAQYGPSVMRPSSRVSGSPIAPSSPVPQYPSAAQYPSPAQYPSTGYSESLPAPQQPTSQQPTPLPSVSRSMPVIAAPKTAPAPLGLPMSMVPEASSLGGPQQGLGYSAQPYDMGGPYLGNAGCSSCNNGSCGSACGPACGPGWYVSLSGLYLGRDESNLVWTTHETGDSHNPLLHSNEARADWQGGGELRFGKRIGCSCWSWDVTYWSLGTMNGYASQTHASGVTSVVDTSELEFSGTNATTYFNGAHEQRLWRNNDFHSVELNFINACLCGNPGSGFSIGGILGLRYFRFEENLTLGSLCGGGVWHANGGIEQAYLDDNIENDLFGFQFGFDTRWRSCGCRWGAYATPKFGIYNNHISNRFHAYRGDGVSATPTVASGVNGSYPINSARDRVAFLTQLDLGVDYAITPCWSVGVGYRVLVATGVGLADHQFPHNAVDIPKIADIDSNGSLILHGAMFTVTYSR